MKAASWIDAIPPAWQAKRLKFSAPLRNDRGQGTAADAGYVGLESIQSWTGRFVETATADEGSKDKPEEGTTSRFCAGDVLFGKLRPYLAKAWLADRDGSCTTELLVMQTEQDFDGSFLRNVCLCSDFITLVDASTFGAKMPRANWEFIGGLRVPVPPLADQHRIAAYLDAETRQMDALVAEKEAMLKLLEEKRAAQISHAVTRGLNPRAPLKPSALPWLGDIPKHWDVRRAKWHFREIDDRTETGEEKLLSLRMEKGLVPHNDVSDKPIKSDEIIGYKRVTTGQLVINRMRSSMGLIAVSPQIGLVSPDYAVFELTRDIDAEYYLALFKTPLVGSVFRSASRGMGNGSQGFLRLYSENFLGLHIPVPPLEEQRAIVAHLAAERERTAGLEAALRESIHLLQERRRALITAAVTGQITI